MAGNSVRYTDYDYATRLAAAQAAQHAKEQADAESMGHARGAATIAEWQTTHPGMQYGAEEAQTKALKFNEADAARRQQEREWNSANEMADLARNRAQMANSAYGGMLSGTGAFGAGGGMALPGVSAPAQNGPSSVTSVASSVPNVAHVDTSGAQSGEFARAKDQVGQESAGALTGLRAALAGRGMLGSGAEGRGTANVVMRGQGELGDVSRAQASDRAAADEREAKTNYEGDLTQRGQDIAMRGQDISAQEEANNLQMQYAQLASQQRSAALAGLQAAIKY